MKTIIYMVRHAESPYKEGNERTTSDPWSAEEIPRKFNLQTHLHHLTALRPALRALRW